MSEQKTLFTNEQLLSLLEDWNHDIGINEPSAVHAAIVRTMNELRRAIDQAAIEQLMPTILEGLPNLNGGDYPYSLPDDLEDAFGISQWDDRTWGEMIDETGYIEYPIHAPMSDAFRALGKDGEWNAKNLAFAKLFPLERLDEIRQWAKKVYGWDCDIDVSLECCSELTYDGLGDEEVISAWGYLYVGPYVPKKRDNLPSEQQQDWLQCRNPTLPMNMDLAPFGDENSFLEWLVCGLGEWVCVSETGNIADHKAEIQYIKYWWLAMTGTRMKNIRLSLDEECDDGTKMWWFDFNINREDIQAVYGHLMEEPVEFGPSNVDVHPPVADCPVESIMDQIDHLSPEQLDMLLERIHADYGVEHETSTSMIIDHPA